MANELIVGVQNTAPMSTDSFIGTVLALPDAAQKVELLRELIAMKNAEQERNAKAEFDRHFAELRAELPTVTRSKENTFLKSKYATLDAIQTACDPVIFKHGFSYSWREEAIEHGKRIWLDISGYGHTKSNYFDAPDIGESKATNVIQAAGIASSYGQRYTFKAGFGLVTVDEDTDGSLGPSEALAAELDAISACDSMEMLQATFGQAWNKFATDAAARKIISGAKDAKKCELSKTKA